MKDLITSLAGITISLLPALAILAIIIPILYWCYRAHWSVALFATGIVLIGIYANIEKGRG